MIQKVADLKISMKIVGKKFQINENNPWEVLNHEYIHICLQVSSIIKCKHLLTPLSSFLLFQVSYIE